MSMTLRRLRPVLLVLGTALALAAQPGPAKPKAAGAAGRFTWNQIELAWPQGWTKELDTEDKGNRLLRLVSTAATPKVILFLAFSADAGEPDGKYLDAPGLAGLALSYGAVSQAAGTKERATLTFNEVQLGDGAAPASQLTLPTADGKGYASAHAFTRVRDGVMIGGFVLTSGQVGGVIDDPSHHRAIAEAYGILRGIRTGRK